MNPKLLSLHGLKWNPFSPDVPTEALLVTPRLDHFGWRVEHLAREGGFALITGEPGLGKSVALRLLAERLAGGARRSLTGRMKLTGLRLKRTRNSGRASGWFLVGARETESFSGYLWRRRPLFYAERELHYARR